MLALDRHFAVRKYQGDPRPLPPLLSGSYLARKSRQSISLAEKALIHEHTHLVGSHWLNGHSLRYNEYASNQISDLCNKSPPDHQQASRRTSTAPPATLTFTTVSQLHLRCSYIVWPPEATKPSSESLPPLSTPDWSCLFIPAASGFFSPSKSPSSATIYLVSRPTDPEKAICTQTSRQAEAGRKPRNVVLKSAVTS